MHITPKRRRPSWTPGIESLEARALLSGVAIVIPAGSDAADTLDQATELGTFATANISGSIDHHGVDVDWFTFTLDVPSRVTLGGSAGTFGLYNDAAGTTTDPLAEIGHRLLAQFTAAGSDSGSLTRDLAAGTYYVAVSGAGNLHFHPLLAHSGLPGVSGDYVLDISSSSLDLTSSVDPLPLSVDASPLGIWIGLSGTLDFAPLVQITDATGLGFPVATVRETLGGTELQVIPGAPLPPGDYTAVVRDLVGEIRLTVDFTVPAVLGSETGDQGNDTPATALELGDIEDLGLVQVSGIIGDDAYYQLSMANPGLFAGNDVDLYHFQISSTTVVGVQAEVFAQRVGSALDAGLSLYRVDPDSGNLVLVAGHDDSYNQILATDGTVPLYRDTVMTVGLLAGDYYLAVSQAGNTAAPLEGLVPGEGSGIYDPTLPHSGSNGWNIGRYVLNLQVSPLGDSPEVVAVSIENHSVQSSAPTEFSVRFDEFMILTEPAFATFQQYSQSTLAGIFISDAQGHKYFPRLLGFDPSNFEARFQMADRLPPGHYQFHLSGNLGVTNLAGVPLAGNSNSGDYVVQFSVAQHPVGTKGNPLIWTHDPQTDAIPTPQQLGVLFPQELKSGVAFVRASGSGSNQLDDTADEYRFQILQSRTYRIHLDGSELPAGVTLALFDREGNAVSVFSPDNGLTLLAHVGAGDYTLRVGTWATSAARRLNYRIDINAVGLGDDAPPLWSGPAPAVGLRLVGIAPPNAGGGNSGSNPGGPGTGGSNGGNGSTGGGGNGLGSPGSNAIRDYSREYLSNRNGTTQPDLSVGVDGAVIAIPTVTSSTRSLSSLLRTSRAVGQGTGVRDRLSLSGLSDLADGPIGKVNGRYGGGLETALTGHKLSDLIKLSLSTKPQGITDRTTAANEVKVPPKPVENPDPADVSFDADAVTADEHSNEADRNPSTAPSTTGQETNPHRDAVSSAWDVHLRQTAPPSLEQDVEVLLAESRSSMDTVFAAGLGLLLSELCLSQEKAARATLRAGNSANRAGRGRHVHLKSQRQEESVS